MKGPGTVTMGGEYQSRGEKPPLVLNAEYITNAVVATETNGATLVSYAKGLQPQAEIVARSLERAHRESERFMDMPLAAPHVYLLRLEGERRTIRFSMTVPASDQRLPWLMVLTNSPPTMDGTAPDKNSIWKDLNVLPFHIFLLAHETCEMRLINPKDLLVMADMVGRQGIFKITLKHHTRWFRDGLANFCALKASEGFRRQLEEEGAEPGAVKFGGSGMRPFTELARVRGKVFDWNQSSDEDYYSAATALFLLIEQYAGADAISAIIHELPNVKFPDGNALIQLIEQKSGLDLEFIARTFEFPDLGMELKASSTGENEIKSIAPESWAIRANLIEGDVVVAVNGVRITDFTSIELEILKAFSAGEPLSLTFRRDGMEKSTGPIALPARKGREGHRGK